MFNVFINDITKNFENNKYNVITHLVFIFRLQSFTQKSKHINQNKLKLKLYLISQFGKCLYTTLMFNVFINDITKNFENNKSTPLKLIDSNIGCLLFADDLLILSETKKGLQHSLNNLYIKQVNLYNQILVQYKSLYHNIKTEETLR
jgi:ATP/ADP translocase